MDENTLSHYGVKGMKWGVRKEREHSTSTRFRGKYNTSFYQKHKENLYNDYKAKGMNAKQASVATERRLRAEKVLAIAGGVTLATAGIYVANNKRKYSIDTIVSSKRTLQNITLSDDPTALSRYAFYTAYTSGDKAMYKGVYGAQLSATRGKQNGRTVKQMLIQPKRDIKVASRKASEDAFVHLYRTDSDFRKAFHRSNKSAMPKTIKETSVRLTSSIAQKRADKRRMSERALRRYGYDSFNIGLVNHDENGNLVANKFFAEMKKRGYDAIKDVNDSSYSGYRTKNPLIVFNGDAIVGKVRVSSVRNSDMVKAGARGVSTRIAKYGSVGVMTAAGTIGANRYVNYGTVRSNERNGGDVLNDSNRR